MQRQVTFRGLSPAAGVVDEVYKQAAKLDGHMCAFESCHVVVEANGRAGRTRTSCRVTVRLWGSAPSGMFCGSVERTHVGDLRPAVHQAFQAVRRQLSSRRQRAGDHIARA